MYIQNKILVILFRKTFSFSHYFATKTYSHYFSANSYFIFALFCYQTISANSNLLFALFCYQTIGANSNFLFALFCYQIFTSSSHNFSAKNFVSLIALDSAIKQENTVRLSKKIVWKKSANKQQNSANKHAERLPVVVLHLLHPAVVLFVALVGFLAELSPEVGSLPETGHGRFGKSLLQIRIVSYH